MIKTCPICGKSFSAPPTGRATCSAGCSSIYRSKKHRGVSNTWSDNARQRLRHNSTHIAQAKKQIKIASAAAAKLPESQRGPQNRESKVWIIRSPDGQTLRIVCLTDWIRQNYLLFEPDTKDPDKTCNRIRSGFAAVAASLRGTRKGRPAGSYKGWQLISVTQKTADDQLAALQSHKK